MLSTILFIVGLIKNLLYVAIPIGSYFFLLKNNNIRCIVNNAALVLIFTNLTPSIGLLVGQSGQALTALLLILLSANVFKSFIENKNLIFCKRQLIIIAIVLLYLIILPSLFFFINSPELLSNYEFWAKRILLILILMLLGFFSSVYSLNSIQFIVQVVFLINCFGVLSSFFIPEIFMLFVDSDDPLLEAGLNPMGGGFFLNPNAAALSVIFGYLGLIYLKNYIKNYKLIVYSIILILTLAIAGSRSGFICGGLTLLTASKSISLEMRHKMNLKSVTIISLLILTSVVLLLNALDNGSISGFSRIIDIRNEGNLESNDLRWNALVKGMELALHSPLSGSGFALRAQLLDLQPHNTFVAYAIDIGIIGLLAFPIFIAILMKMIFHQQDKLYFRITVISILFMGLFDHEVINSKPFGFLLFVAIAVSKMQRAFQIKREIL